jgi:hypothetical protein
VLALICCLAAGELSPAWIHQVAARDLQSVHAECVRAGLPDARPYTRYLSLHGIPDAERRQFRVALDLALNGVSIRGDLYHPRLVGGGLLVRLDLRPLGWDKFNRAVELDKLERLGVKLDFKSDRDKQFYLDIWETIGFFEPYFVASECYRRGWLNPVVVDAVERVAHTRKLVAAAHWLYPRLLLERQDGGFYSQLLVLPPKLADLEKRLGVFRAFADVDLRAKHGAAIVKSASVAYNPREVQFLGSMTGHDQRWYSLTHDFLKVDRADKDVRESPAGTSKPDASEVLFTIPNGLMGGYLANGQGVQVAFAPQQVAEDQRPTVEGRYYSPTKTVVNVFKCFDCHMENRGLLGLDDNARKLIVPPRLDTGYFVVDRDPVRAAREVQRIEEFYRPKIREQMDLYRASLEARVEELTGQDCLAASRNELKWYDRFTPVYAAELVWPQQASREMAYPEQGARALWKAASDTDKASQLGILAGGQPITRIRWEQFVGKALERDVFYWDRIKVHP